MDICQIGYDICEFDSLRGLGIDVIGRVHFDNRDRFAIWMGSIGDRTMSTNEWLLTSDFWQFLEPWHGRWCEYEIFIASCTDNIYDLENERWLLGTWLIMLGFMDLGWPRVYRRSTSVLLSLPIALKFDRHLCSSDWFFLKRYEHFNIQSYGFETLQNLSTWPFIETGLRQQHTKLKWSHGSSLLLQPSKTCINNT